MINTPNKDTSDYWADWLVDAVATATQDRRFLRGDPAEDKVATEALYANGKKALENLVRHRAMANNSSHFPRH